MSMDCVVNIICETLNGSSTLPVYHCLSYFRQIDLKQKQHGFLQDWKYFLSKKSVLTSIKRISANLYQTIIVHLPNICLYKLLASFYKESGKLLTVVTYCPKPPRNINCCELPKPQQKGSNQSEGITEVQHQ